MNNEAEKFQEAAERYLRYLGCDLAVLGGIEIRRPNPKYRAKYELVMGYVGTAPVHERLAPKE